VLWIACSRAADAWTRRLCPWCEVIRDTPCDRGADPPRQQE